MKYPISIAVGLLSLALTGCVPGKATSDLDIQSIEISPATQAALDTYLLQVTTTRFGAFAVSEDGTDSYFVWCADMTCAAISYAVPAVALCESVSGKRCVTLFVHDEPRIAFTRATAGGSGGKHGSNESGHRTRRGGPHLKEDASS